MFQDVNARGCMTAFAVTRYMFPRLIIVRSEGDGHLGIVMARA